MAEDRGVEDAGCISILIVAGCGSSATTSNPAGGGGQGSPAALTTPAPADQAATPAALTTPGPADQAATPAPAGFNVCTLLTPAEVATAIGETAKQASLAGNALNCRWAATSADSQNGAAILIYSLAQYDTVKANVGGTPVTGVGDDAFFSGAATDLALIVKKGSKAFVVLVTIVGASADKLQAAEKSLALLVVGRI
jgi:hypothetical protein